MISIAIEHDYCHCWYEFDPEELITLQQSCSYFVKDAERSEMFQEGKWDGTKTLFRKVRNRNQGYFPTGLYQHVITQLSSVPFQRVHVEDRRVYYQTPSEPNTHNLLFEPREYQLEAVKAMLQHRRGILKLPTGTGKTKTAILGIRTINLPTLWLTHESALGSQTKQAFEESLFQPEVAFYKSTTPEIKFWTIGLVKSIWLRRKELKWWLDQVRVLVIDECHHGTARTWYDVAMSLPNAQYRFGISATPFERGDDAHLELIGTTGLQIYTRDTEELKQYLSRPHVQMIHLPRPTFPILGSTWDEVYTRAIVEYEPRNKIILDKAVKCTQEEKTCIIFVNRISHGEFFEEKLEQMIGLGCFHTFISGQTPQSARNEIYSKLRTKQLRVLIAMDKVAGEGQDIPAVNSLIMAGAGKGIIGTKQRTGRGMRPEGILGSDGWNGKVEVFDFADNHQFRLQQQSDCRRGTYASINAVITENFDYARTV